MGESKTVANDQADGPSRSIMRRASIFGPSKSPSEKKPKETPDNKLKSIKSNGGMANMMEEMKLKALKRKTS